ncbi:alkyl sulfatase C-terminal domain-containing protein [Nocardia sp. NPDC001965]
MEPERADEILDHPEVTSTGDTGALHELAQVIDTFDPNFNLSTP